MPISNIIASVAVRDLDVSIAWYSRLLGSPCGPMTHDVAEWSLPDAGSLQLYVLPERAGQGSFTVSVTDIEEQANALRAIGIDRPVGPSNDRVRTLMIKDPDGNSIAFAQSMDVLHEPAQLDATADQSLRSLSMLEGDWHGNGIGPYGQFDHETRAELRGRWLLLTGTILVPNTETVTYVSTQVFGYDDDGLLLRYFDTAGAFDFRGERVGDGLTFAWKCGKGRVGAEFAGLWKTSEFTPRTDDRIDFRYRSMEGPVGAQPVSFEGTWTRGPRRQSVVN